MSCPGDSGTCDVAICYEALATCDTFDCSGQSTNTVNKGIGVSCSGHSGTCDAVSSCEASATGDTFDCSGQSTNTVNKGIDVSCSGDSGTCAVQGASETSFNNLQARSRDLEIYMLDCIQECTGCKIS